jgi:hypothetical protein
MAEQSIGMTTGTGDGTVGGYLNTRMTAKDLKTIGAGILGDMPAVTGSGTSTLTIDACDINVNGYFYQNTTSLNISVSAVSPGTYTLVCRVNDAGTAQTVIRSASGTTIPLRTVRICLVDNYIFAATDAYITTVIVSGGIVSSIDTVTGGYAVSTAASKSDKCYAAKSTTQTISSANVATTITWDTFSAGNSGIFKVTAPDTFTNQGAGTYMLSGYLEYPTGSTGSRMISGIGAAFGNIASNLLSSIAAVPSTGPIRQTFQYMYSSVGATSVVLQVTSSVAGETVTAGRIILVRL